MARVKDLWFVEVKDPNDPTKKIKKKTARHGSGKRWLATWTDPSGKERTRAFTKKIEADRYASSQETDAARGLNYIDPKTARITVKQWVDTWLTGYATRRKATVRQAKVHLERIKAEFGAVPLAAVRPSHVKSWTARLREEGLADSYVYALHARLAQVMSDAVHDGLLARSPCSRRTSPGAGGQRPFVASTEQVWRLYDVMPKRYRVAVLLGAFVGLRVSEACGLRVEDVDFMRGVVRPAMQYPAEPLKTETSRTPIPIPRSLSVLFSAQVAEWPGEWLLTKGAGIQLGPWAVERAFRTARGKVDDLPEGFRFHDLRHYFASLLIASGADVKVVQARLRHASAKTTLDCYGHLWPDSDESTREAVDAVLAARTEQGRNAEGAR